MKAFIKLHYDFLNLHLGGNYFGRGRGPLQVRPEPNRGLVSRRETIQQAHPKFH